MEGSQTAEDELNWRKWIMDHAELVRAFESSTFAVDEAEDAPLAAGALIVAATQTIDELFQDIETLAANGGGTVAESDGPFFVLEDLPQRFAHHYDGRFARSFHVATVMITGRLSAEQWLAPSSVAEALALHLVIQRAQTLLVDHDLVDHEPARQMYLAFQDDAFDDADHEWLYRPDLDGFETDGTFAAKLGSADMRAESWFHQLADAPGYVHAFSIDIAEPGSEDDGTSANR
jgi:hypothetical protein